MRKPKAPRSVTVAIFTTITIIFWVFLSLYRVLTTKPDAEVPPEILAPINPSLDTETLRILSNRVFFEESEVIVPTPLAPEVPTLLEEASSPEILIPTSTPSASQEEP